MSTSGTVGFRPDVEQIIAEAYERCGIDAQSRTGYQAVSARLSLNLLFSEWANRGINYWTVQNKSFVLVNGQTTPYAMPEGTIDLIDVVIRETSEPVHAGQAIHSEFLSVANTGQRQLQRCLLVNKPT